jgi:hypothetical protein
MGQRAGYDPEDYEYRISADPTTRAILRTETSGKFHGLMDAAMLTSYFKYGAVANAYPEHVNAISTPAKLVEKFAVVRAILLP